MSTFSYKYCLVLVLALVCAVRLACAQSDVEVRIYALHDFPAEDLEVVKEALENYYVCDVEVCDADFIFPSAAMNENMIFAQPLLDSLKDQFETDIKTILLTTEKLAITKLPFSISDYEFLMRGLSISIPGNLAIISTDKIRYETCAKEEYDQLLIETVRHELGHLMGLFHCDHTNCLMHTGVESFENSQLFSLCEKCTVQLNCIQNQ